MNPFVHRLRVGYADTDKMGFAHHSRIVVYLETARTELLRAIGQSYRQWEESGVLLPVVSLSLDYKKPAYYDDELDIETRLVDLTRARVRFGYRVSCPAREALLSTGETGHVFMNAAGRPMRAGPEIVALLSPLLEQGGPTGL